MAMAMVMAIVMAMAMVMAIVMATMAMVMAIVMAMMAMAMMAMAMMAMAMMAMVMAMATMAMPMGFDLVETPEALSIISPSIDPSPSPLLPCHHVPHTTPNHHSDRHPDHPYRIGNMRKFYDQRRRLHLLPLRPESRHRSRSGV